MSITTPTPAEVRLGSALDEIEGIATCWRVATARDALAELVAERDRLRDQNARLASNSRAESGERVDAESTIADLRTKLAVAEARVDLLQRANADAREAIGELDANNRRLRAAIRALVDPVI